MGVNTAASAEELFQDFTVDANLGGKNAIFTADKITGNYTEIIDFFANGTFQVSLYWEAAAFVQNDGQNSLNAKTTGLGANYGLYALYTADGTFTMQGAATSFNFTAGSGSLNVFLDPNLDTNYVSVNKSDFVASGTNGDIRLAAGSPLERQRRPGYQPPHMRPWQGHSLRRVRLYDHI